MRKTITITIGGALFHVEEPAFARLDQYLDSIRGHFASYKDSDEIVSDIEARIAEEFSEKLKGRKTVITTTDVDALIRNMGTVEDFEKFDTEPGRADETAHSAPPYKRGRLYRDSEDQILGGVCAGIANYFGIDPTFVRIIFAASLLVGGMGFILYILLWIILPEAKTATEKVEMSGGKVTLSALQRKIDESVPPEKRKTMMRKTVAFPALMIRQIVRAIGRVLRVTVPVIGRVFGFMITISTAIGVAATTSMLFVLAANPQSPYIDFPLFATVGAANYYLLLLSGFFVLFIPLIFVLLVGVSLLTMRSAFTTMGVAAMAAVWFIAIATGSATGFAVAPAVQAAAQQYEDLYARMTEKAFDLHDFTGISADGHARVIVTQGPDYSVTLQATSQDLEFANVRVEKNILRMSPGSRRRHCFFFCHRGNMTLTVTMPTLEYAQTNGVVHATIRGFSGSALRFAADGHSLIEADVSASTLAVGVNGVSRVDLRGSADSLTAVLDGASSLGAYDFPVQAAKVTMDGVSRAMIDATEELTGEVDGNASLFYQTVPARLDIKEDGIATVEQRDEDTEKRW